MTDLKPSRELAEIMRQVSEEVESWPAWKRSLDPLGDVSLKQQEKQREVSHD